MPFIVMEVLVGEPLDKRLERLGRLGVAETVRVLQQVCRALTRAHDQGIVHRDLKPENIIVGPYGEVVIMDWGLARPLRRPGKDAPPPAPVVDKTVVDEAQVAAMLADSVGEERHISTRLGTIIGTPAYMSPEQARGRHDLVDERSDLYALAAIFYELLTLEHYLTPKRSPQHMLIGVMTEEPLAATAIHHRYAVPPEYTFYLRRGLSKKPEERFQSASEMTIALREILSGDIPVQCPCTGLKAAGNRWFDFIDDHPFGAITAAVLTGTCALYGAYGLVGRLLGLVLHH